MEHGDESPQLWERLVRIETKLDLYIVNGIQDHETRLRQIESYDTADHDERISKLEAWRYAIPASVLTGMMSAGTAIWIALGR